MAAKVSESENLPATRHFSVILETHHLVCTKDEYKRKQEAYRQASGVIFMMTLMWNFYTGERAAS